MRQWSNWWHDLDWVQQEEIKTRAAFVGLILIIGVTLGILAFVLLYARGFTQQVDACIIREGARAGIREFCEALVRTGGR